MEDTYTEQRIRESFDEQSFMRTLGAQLIKVESGLVEIAIQYDESLTQQDGFMHAGALTSVMDSACGYAALTQMPEKSRVLSIEFKVNLLRPAQGSSFVAIGKVIKSGKTITVCEGELYADNRDRIIAKIIATMICLQE